MGKTTVTLVLLGAVVMAGCLFYIRSFQTEFQTASLGAIIETVQNRQSELSAVLPPGLRFAQPPEWSGSFKGDELFVQAPELTEENGSKPSPERFDEARGSLTETLHGWLSKKPGDSKRFPIRLLFKNEQ